jgi:hypothetical protein
MFCRFLDKPSAFGAFRLQGGVGFCEVSGALGDPALQLFHFPPGLLVQPPFLRERARQLNCFHSVKRLLENDSVQGRSRGDGGGQNLAEILVD